MPVVSASVPVAPGLVLTLKAPLTVRSPVTPVLVKVAPSPDVPPPRVNGPPLAISVSVVPAVTLATLTLVAVTVAERSSAATLVPETRLARVALVAAVALTLPAAVRPVAARLPVPAVATRLPPVLVAVPMFRLRAAASVTAPPALSRPLLVMSAPAPDVVRLSNWPAPVTPMAPVMMLPAVAVIASVLVTLTAPNEIAASLVNCPTTV